MAVQLITNKIVKKYDTQHPNFKPEPEPVKEVDGNIKNDIYGEQSYQVPSKPTGNLKMEEMMSKMMGKIDNLNGTKSQTGTEAIEVDIEREIAISMVDQNAVKSEVTLGRVKTKKDKLRQLRKKY
jgi:hypothetical protein